jgi:acetyl-CoA acyltransferase
MTGIPIVNVNNNCSTGSTALYLAAQSIRGGLADCVIALGFEKMQPGSLGDGAANIIGYDMNVQAAQQVYDQSGLGPADFQVIELHDCFSANELLLYEALGLCGEGEAPKLIDDGDTTYGGRWVVNPSGGLISKGHPLGATGLAQCAELTWQLRGTADRRQVDGVTAALQHNIGLGGAAVVTAYQRAER